MAVDVTASVASFAWLIQAGLGVMIIVELVRVFTSFKSSNKDKDDESFMQNVKSLFGKSDEQKNIKEEEARKKQLETEESERKIEEMGRYIAGLSIDAKNNVEVLIQGHIKLVEVESNPNFFSITKDVSDKVVERMLSSANKIEDDFKKLRKIELGPLKTELDKLKQDIADNEKIIEDIRNDLLSDINDVQKHPEIPDVERDKFINDIKKQIVELDNIITSTNKLSQEIHVAETNLSNNIKSDVKFDTKIIQSSNNIIKDLKTINKALKDLSKKINPKSKGIAHGTYRNKLVSLKKDIDFLESGMKDEMLRIETEFNNFSNIVKTKITDLKEITNNINTEISKLHGK